MLAKRLVALVLMVIMIITPVAVVSAAQWSTAELGSDGTFVPRLTAPKTSNKYYYSELNILYRVGYGMPNCTAYAWGRAYEIMGYEPDLSVNDADTWWDYNKENHSYSYGSEPKLGAIACWEYTTGGGHVAVVEKIEDGEITFSNSAYGGKEFYLTYADVDDPTAGACNWTWVFKGYIYITDGQSKEDYYQSLGGDIYKVDSYDGINLRNGAGTSYKTLTAIPDGTQIVVSETKNADGYIWGKTSYDGYSGWCVLKYTELVYKQPEPTTTGEPATTVPETTVLPETSLSATVDEIIGATFDEAEPDVTEPAETVESTQGTLASEEVTTDAVPNILGDANGDGKISVADATLIQKFLAKVGEILPENMEAADMTGDGRISVTDATAIQKKLAGI